MPMTQVVTDTFDFSVLLRRKWHIFLCGLVAAVLALGLSKILPRQYASEGGMLVENAEPSVPELGIGIPTGGGADNHGVVLTNLDILRSRGLVAQVVKDDNLVNTPNLIPALKLPVSFATIITTLKKEIASVLPFSDTEPSQEELSPTDATIAYVQKNLKVDATENSNVISIRFVSGSPNLSTSVVNSVMEAYLAQDMARRQLQIGQVNKWLSDRAAELLRQADTSALAVEQFVREHNQPEIQGSSAAAIQLSKDQETLATARQALAEQQAILDSMRNGASGTRLTLESRTIETYKDRAAQLQQQVALLSSLDPRRRALQQALNSIEAQINAEIDKIVIAARHAVEIDHAKVLAAQSAVGDDMLAVMKSSVSAATLARLKADADTKRQLYVAFGTRNEQTQLAAAQLPTARVLYPAAPDKPTSFTILALLFGFIGGIFLSIAHLILRESFSRTISTSENMSVATGLPMFGCLPEVKKAPLMLAAPDTSMIAETLRSIWYRLRPYGKPEEGRIVLVTSSEVGEGKTTVAASLAHRMAGDGYRVLLVDADLRRPRLGSVLRLKPIVPLEALLGGSVTLSQAVLHDPDSKVDCLLADGSSVNPMRALSSDSFAVLLAECKSVYDFIVIDSPPVMRVTDAALIAKLCHHVLFIVRSGHMTGELVSEAIRRFAEEDREKICTLLNRVRERNLRETDYFGGYASFGNA
jgi:succinoglycan biosynthesis transport protein ExoP